jgi:putative transposase
MRPRRADNFGTYFVTTKAAEGRMLLQSERCAKLLIDVLYHYRGEERFLVHDFVVMPNHLHAIVTPAETIERTMQLIKGGFSYRAKHEIGIQWEIWQRGYTDHRIRDWNDFARHREYLRMNPVRAHLCERAEQFPFSSAVGSFDLDPVPQRLKPLIEASD